MNAEEIQFHSYFASAIPKLWSWQDKGEVIAWHDGTTISFRQELVALLERQETSGFPGRFGALVLLLSACRDSWSRAGAGKSFLMDVRQQTRVEHLADRVERTLQSLDKVHSMKHLMPTAAARAELAEMIFLQCRPKLSAKESGQLLSMLRHSLEPLRVSCEEAAFSFDLFHDLHCLATGFESCSLDDFERRLQTGIEFTLRSAPVVLPPADLARSLISALSDDEQLGGVARLARLLLAAVRIPTALSDPEEFRVSGVSDISNRGTLDRLLLSELANDDLTLASRVALNEALYLRRERIDRPTSLQRFVLIDSGMRMWGVPRVFAAAVGLAVVAQAQRNVQVSAFRSNGSECIPSDFTTLVGLNQHLASLDFRVHPGRSLPKFHELIHNCQSRRDALVITSEEVWRDYEFVRSLKELELDSIHIAVINRQGRFQLVRLSKRGSQIINEAAFALDEVLAPRPGKESTSRILDQGRESLPAIFRTTPFPLRLSVPVTLDDSWHIDGLGIFTLRYDGQLFLRDQKGQGARLIQVGLPSGRILCGPARATGSRAVFVIGKMHHAGMYVLHYDRESDQATAVRLAIPWSNPTKLFCHGNYIFVANANSLAVLDANSGALRDECPFTNASKLQVRYYPVDEHDSRIGAWEWNVISYDGAAIRFDRVHAHMSVKEVLSLARANAPRSKFPRATNPPLLSVFDSIATPYGPVGIVRNGFLVFLGKDGFNLIQLRHGSGPVNQLQLAAVSRDGTRVVFTRNPSSYGHAKSYERADIPHDTKTDQVTVTEFGTPAQIAERHWMVWANVRPVRSRFTGIFVDAQGRLTLESRHGAFWPLSYDPIRKAIVFPKRIESTSASSAIRTFTAVKNSAFPDLLRQATWEDGSTALLDRRGLLHLKSSNPSIPEVSIVLTEGPVSGWTSEGTVWGESYFIGNQCAVPAEVIYDRILRPFADRLWPNSYFAIG